MFDEFKKFAMRGNVIDLAVGVIIGASFTGIVTSLVNDVIMPPIGLALGGVFGWDKMEHFTAYFGLASMATLMIGFKPRLAWAFLGIILFGAILEILQAYTGRDPEVLDFIANSIGAFAGLSAGALFLWLLDPLVGTRAAD